MNDPERLLASEGEDVRAMLRAAAEEEPSAAASAQLRHVLGLAASAPPPAPVPAAEASRLALVGKWVGMASLGLLASYGALQLAEPLSPSARRELEAAAATPTATRNPEGDLESARADLRDQPRHATRAPADDGPQLRAAAPAPASLEPEAARDNLGDERRRPEGAVSQPLEGARTAPSDAAARPLRDELQRLEAARAALPSAPEQALRTLDAYDSAYKRGTLREEARALRIDALLASSRREEAQALARSFLQTYPTSVHATRIRAQLDAR